MWGGIHREGRVRLWSTAPYECFNLQALDQYYRATVPCVYMPLKPSSLSPLCVCILEAFKRRFRAQLAVYFLCVCYSMTANFLLFESADAPLGGGMPWPVHLGSLLVLSGTTFHKFHKPTKTYECCLLWTLDSPIQSQGKSNNSHSLPYWRLTAHTYSHNIPQTYLIAVTNMA